MTLEEWLEGKDEPYGEHLNRVIDIENKTNYCCWGEEHNHNWEYWIIAVLEDGTAITYCRTP